MSLEISVSTSTSRLIKKDPDSLGSSLISAILQNQDISRVILTNNFSSYVHKVNAFYNYGATSYINGLPEGIGVFTDTTVILSILGSIENNKPIRLIQTSFSTPNPIFIGKYSAQENEGYNSLDNTINNTEDYFAEAYIEGNVSKVWYQNDFTEERYYREYPYTNLNQNNPCYQIKYTVEEDGYFVVKYFVYFPEDNTYPELNPTNEIYGSPFYPIVPLVIEGTSIEPNNYQPEFIPLTDGNGNVIKPIELIPNPSYDPNYVPAESPLFQSVKSILNKLDFDAYDFIDKLRSNKDFSLIDDAFVNLAVSLNTEDKSSKKYLFDFFYRLAKTSLSTAESNDYYLISNSADRCTLNTFTIEESTYKTDIHYNYITVEIQNISSGQSNTLRQVDPNTVFKFGSDEVETTLHKKLNSRYNDTWDINNSYIELKRKTVNNSYVVIKVYGLIHVSHVYPNNIVVNDIQTVVDYPDKHGFYLPLEQPIVSSYGFNEQEDIYYDCIVLTVYAVQESYLSWYEDPDFLDFISAVLTIVTVVLFVYNIGLALEAGSWLTFIQTIGTNIFYSYLFNFAAEILVDELGLDSAILLAVALYGAAALGGITDSSFLGSADQYLSYATKFSAGISEKINSDMREMQTEYEQYKEEYDEVIQEIEDILEDLDGVGLNPLIFTDTVYYNNFNETPEVYYEKSIHNKNPGVQSLKDVHTFVKRALMLPKI